MPGRVLHHKSFSGNVPTLFVFVLGRLFLCMDEVDNELRTYTLKSLQIRKRTRLPPQYAADLRQIMTLCWSSGISLESSRQKPSKTFANLNCSMSILAIHRNVSGEMVKIGNIIATQIMRQYLLFIKFDTVISTNQYHRRRERNRYSERKRSDNIQLINNLDKGSGNTLLLSSQTTKNQKSTVSECLKLQYKKNERNMLFLLL